MKTNVVTMTIGAVLATATFFPPGSGLAAEEHGAHHEMGVKASAAETPGGIWRDVKTHETELGELITAKDLGKVHEKAFAIRDLVSALPAKSQQLSAEQQTKLKGSVKYVATLAQRLDTAGDAKDQSATEAAFKQLQSVLDTIEALYPPDVLK